MRVPFIMAASTIFSSLCLLGYALAAPAPCEPTVPSDCFCPNTPYSFFSSVYAPEMPYSYYPTNMCAPFGIDVIPAHTPTCYFDDIDKMMLEAKCKWLSSFSEWYPPNIGPNVWEMPRERLTYDFVIVNGGPGSLSIVPLLIEEGFKVVILEEGLCAPPIAQSAYYRPALLNSPFVKPYQAYIPGCLKPKTFYVPECFGGVSLFDFNTWQYGSRDLYNNLAEFSEIFSWENACTRYKKIEYQKTTTTITKETQVSVSPCGSISISTKVKETSVTTCITAVWSEMGYEGGFTPLDIDYTPGLSVLPSIGNDDEYLLYPQEILSGLPSFENIDIILGCQIQRLVYECGRIIGVEIMTEYGPKIIYTTYDVILGSSPVTIFELLTRSGFGNAMHLSKFNIPLIAELPALGTHLRVNPIYINPFIYFPQESLITEYVSDYNSVEFMFGGNGVSSVSSLSFYNAFQNVRGSSFANIMYRFYPFNSHMSYRIELILGYYFQLDYEMIQYVKNLCLEYDVLFIVPQHLYPRSIGCLEFGETIENISINLGMYTEEEDILDMIEAVQYIEKIGKTAAFTNLGGQLGYLPLETIPCTGDFFSPDYIRRTLPYCSIPNLHPAGGAIMGTDINTSVVNSNFYVHNVPNLLCLTPAISPFALQSDSIAFSTLLGQYGFEFIMDRYNSGFYEELLLFSTYPYDDIWDDMNDTEESAYESEMRIREMQAMAGSNLKNLTAGGFPSSYMVSEAEASSFSSDMITTVNGVNSVQSFDSSYKASEYESASTNIIGGSDLMGGGMVSEYERAEAEASNTSYSTISDCGGISFSQTTSETVSENLTTVEGYDCGC